MLSRAARLRRHRPRAVDPPGALVEIAGRQQLFRAHAHRLGIADMRFDVGHAELGGLDLQMLHFRAIGIEPPDIDAIEDAQRDQRGQPLPVGRKFVNAIALEIDAQRRDPVRANVRPDPPAHSAPPSALAAVGDPFRDPAAIESLALRIRDELERFGLIAAAENFACRRRAAIAQEGLREARELPERLRLLPPHFGDDRGDEEAVARVADRGLEERREGQSPELAV